MSYETTLLNSEVYTYEYFQQENVCRLCWNQQGVHGLFTKHTENRNYKEPLAILITNCFNIEIKEDSFPKNVCGPCCFKVEEYSKFKSFCSETQKRLEAILRNVSNGAATTFEVKVESIDEGFPVLTSQPSEPPTIKLEYESSVFSDHINDNVNSDNFPETNEPDYQMPSDNVKKQIKNHKATPQPKSRHSLNLEQEAQLAAKVVCGAKKKKYQPKRTASYCNICRLDLGSKEKLVSHNSVSHGIEEGNIYKCFGCVKRFKARKARLSHEVNFCKGLREGYKCGRCHRYLPRRSMYEAHMRDHRLNPSVVLPEKIFQCAKCYLMFKTKQCLKEHMVTHNRKKKYVCEICGRIFNRQDYLHKHKLTHTGTKQHVCSLCGYRTSQKSSLTIHIRKHTGERPYQCQLCPQQCTSSSNLRAHTKRHLGQKLFECTICNKKFGYKISLEEHVSTVHERSREPYPCEHCGATYIRMRGLRRHLLAKHAKLDTTQPPIDGDTSQGKVVHSSALFLKIGKSEDKNSVLKHDEVFQTKDSCDEYPLLAKQDKRSSVDGAVCQEKDGRSELFQIKQSCDDYVLLNPENVTYGAIC